MECDGGKEEVMMKVKDIIEFFSTGQVIGTVVDNPDKCMLKRRVIIIKL